MLDRMILIRRLLFWGFTIVYIIVCPLLILYALGYIYSPVAGELIHTGILHIETIPAGADVYLEKSHYKHQTPVTIGEMIAGDYKVTLRKKGYKPWTHSITIEGGKAAAFDNILLIPLIWPQKEKTSYRCRNLFDIEDKRMFLFSTGEELGSFSVYNVDGGIRPLLISGSSFASMPVKEVSRAAGSSEIIIYAGRFLDRRFLYLNPKEEEANAIDITNLFEGELSSAVWQDKEGDLFYRQKNCINRISIRTQKAYPCYLEGIKGFGIHDEWMYVIDANDVLSRRLADGRKEEKLSEDVSAAKRLLRRSEFYDIDAANEAVIIFLGTEGDLLVNMPPYYIATEDVLGYGFSGSRDSLAFWTKTNLAIADFSVGRGDTFFYEGFSVRAIYEKGRNYKQVFWVDDKSHILCNDAGNVYLIELLPQGPAHVEPVVRIKDDTSVFYDGGEKALYYIDEDSGVLKQLDIISKQTIKIELPAKRD